MVDEDDNVGLGQVLEPQAHLLGMTVDHRRQGTQEDDVVRVVEVVAAGIRLHALIKGQYHTVEENHTLWTLFSMRSSCSVW